jgi:hypothetical protein
MCEIAGLHTHSRAAHAAAARPEPHLFRHSSVSSWRLIARCMQTPRAGRPQQRPRRHCSCRGAAAARRSGKRVSPRLCWRRALRLRVWYRKRRAAAANSASAACNLQAATAVCVCHEASRSMRAAARLCCQHFAARGARCCVSVAVVRDAPRTAYKSSPRGFSSLLATSPLTPCRCDGAPLRRGMPPTGVTLRGEAGVGAAAQCLKCCCGRSAAFSVVVN